MSNYFPNENENFISQTENESNKDIKLIIENSKLKNDIENLKRSIIFYQTELEKYKNTPLLISQVIAIKKNGAIISLQNNNNFLVNISSEFKEKLKKGDMVLCEQKSLTIINKIDISKREEVENFLLLDNKPKISWKDIGGLDNEIEKVKEILELPLKKPQIFKKMGITPPKGILLHGPPGTGKTMIAKALAKETKSTFIELIGSELVQKFIGEGAKLVKELFRLAKDKSPSIIFIDELDAIASKRVDTGTSGEREVHRTFMQLLGEIDGFSSNSNIKVIGATNRIDILDEAIIRPGRFERHIEIKDPNTKGRLDILKIHTKKMNLNKSCNLNEIAKITKNFSGAKLKALATEAGYCAIRKNKNEITQKYLLMAFDELKENKDLYFF